MVGTENVHKWRGVKPPGYIIINQFSTEEALKKFLDSGENSKASELRKQAGTGFAIACTLAIHL